jgi:ferredoxin
MEKVKTHHITLVNRDHRVIPVREDEVLLDSLEAAGITLPYGCRYGACVTCAARLLQGEVDQSEGVALKPAQEAMGYVLLCIAHPLSDCEFEVGDECQDDLYINPFKGKR